MQWPKTAGWWPALPLVRSPSVSGWTLALPLVRCGSFATVVS